MADYICSFSCAWGKNIWEQEVLTGKWEELNTEINVCMLTKTSRFTSAGKYKLIMLI